MKGFYFCYAFTILPNFLSPLDFTLAVKCKHYYHLYNLKSGNVPFVIWRQEATSFMPRNCESGKCFQNTTQVSSEAEAKLKSPLLMNW